MAKLEMNVTEFEDCYIKKAFQADNDRIDIAFDGAISAISLTKEELKLLLHLFDKEQP